jgi:hypothetical protein
MSESSLEFLILNEPISGVFVVYDYLHVPVTGLTQADFDVYLSNDGVDAAEPVSITEVGNGRYKYTFTPLSIGEWYILIVHSVYNPRGWDDEFIVQVDRSLQEGGGASWPYAKDYLRRMRGEYERLDRDRKRFESDDEEALILIVTALNE